MADPWRGLPTFGNTVTYGPRPAEEEPRSQIGGLPDFDLSGLPPMAPGGWKAPEGPKRNVFSAGISAGVDEMQGLGGRAAEAVGRLTGIGPLERWGAGVADRNFAEAAANGRPDLETAPWREGGAPVLPWLGYQASKQIPLLAGFIGAGAISGGALPAGALGASGAAAGMAARLPAVLGGQGLRAGATAAQTAAAREAASQALRFGAGAAAAGYPLAVGSMYNEAKERQEAGGEEAGRGDAAAALALGVPYAALEAVQPTALRGMFKSGTPSSIFANTAGLKGTAARVAERVARGAVAGAVTEAPTEAAQTGMEQFFFRGDLSPGEKARSVVDAFLIGGALGGVFGGAAGGLRRMQDAKPNEVSNEDLKATTEMLALPAPLKKLPPPQAQIGRDALIQRAAAEGQAQGDLFDPNAVLTPTPVRSQPPEEPAAAPVGPDPAQGDLLSWQPPAPPAPPAPVLDRVIEGSDLKLRKQDRAFFEAQDEAELADKVLTVLERQKDNAQSRIAAGIAERLGVDRTPEQMAARGTEIIQQLRTPGLPPEAANELRAELGRVTTGLNLLDAVAERRRVGITNDTNREAAPVVEPPALAPTPTPQTAMGEQLAPLRRQMEFDAARAQQETQIAEAGPTDVRGSFELPAPTAQDVPNIATRTAVEKTIRAFNSLTPDQQNAILDQEEFGGNPQALLDAIAVTSPGAQPSIRRALETYAGLEPGTLERPRPIRRVNAPQPRPAQDTAPAASVTQDATAQPAASAETRQPVARAVWAAIPKRQVQRTEAETLDLMRERIANTRADQLQRLRNMSGLASLDPELQRELTMLADVAGRGDPRVTGRTGLTNEALATRMNDFGKKVLASVEARRKAAEATGKPDVQYSVRQAGEQGTKKPTLVKAQDAAIEALNRGDTKAAEAALQKAKIPVQKQRISGSRPEAPRLNERQIEAIRAERLRQAAKMQTAAIEGQDRVSVADRKAAERRQQAEMIAASGPAFRKTLEKRLFEAVGEAIGDVDRLTTENIRSRLAALKARADTGAPNADLAFMENYRTPDDSLGLTIPGWYQQVSGGINTIAARLGMPPVGVVVADSAPGRDVRGLAIDAENAIALNASLTRFEALAVGLHELGHLVETQLFMNAPQRVRDAVMAAFDRSPQGKTVAQRKPITSRGRPDANNQPADDNYQNSFGEWFAEQVSRWLTTQKEPVSIVDRFFAGVAKVWNQIYAAVTGYVPLTMEVKDFMDGAWRGEIGAQGTVVNGQVRAEMTTTTAPGMNNRAEYIVKESASRWENFKKGKIREAFMGSHLYFATVSHIVDFYKGLFKPGKLEAVAQAQAFRTSAEARLSDLSMKPMLSYERLERVSDKAATQVRELMGYTGWYIDPRKGWDGHKHLHDAPNARELMTKVSEANKLWAQATRVKLKDGEGNFISPTQVYEDLLAVNDTMYYAQHAVELHNLINTNANWQKAVKKAETDPMQAYMEQPSLHEKPVEARKFWKQWVAGLMKETGDYVKKQTEGYKNDDVRSKEVALLKEKLAEISQAMASMERAPYFHLGRQGKYYVEFKIRPSTTKKGFPDPVAQDAVAKALKDAGIDEIEIPIGSENAGVFMRFETLAQMEAARKVADKLAEQGYLAKRTGSPVTSGMREQDDNLQGRNRLINNMIQYFQAQLALVDETGGNTKDEVKTLRADQMKFINQLRQYAINMMPDTSNSKVMTHRKFVGGYSKDMMWSYANRTRLAAHAIANMSSSAKLIDAMVGLQQDIRLQKGEPDATTTVKMQQIFDELSKREATRADAQQVDLIDSIRAWNHAYFLGMSPSYFAVQLTQLGVMLWPELAKKTSFVNAAKTIAQNSTTAGKIMREVFEEARKSGGRKKVLGVSVNTRLPDVNITEEVLKKAMAGDPKWEEKAAFIMAMVNRGKIDLGSASREIGRVVDGKAGTPQDLMLRYASAFGLYSETLTRIAAALSARDVAIKNGLTGRAAQDYAVSVIDQSMFNYQSDNVARAFGRAGLGGPLTPVATAFLQYSFQLMEKMYREFHAMAKGKTPEEKAAARRFIGGHLAAVGMLAGSLGLPLVTVVARVIESMKDLLDDDDKPYDAKAEWRNFLSDVFGKDVGEVLARGLPRAIGVDISQRVGEADILPFSKLIADRRAWEEALPDMLWRTAGAPTSMAANIVEGVSQIASGNLLEGMKTAVPSALRGPVEAYRISQNGFTDKRGNTLPVEVDAWDGIVQALGFQPAGKAEYQEEKFGSTVTKGVLVRGASNIRKNLASAIERGDMDTAREWLTRAQEWDQNNPAYAVLPGLPGVLRQRANERTRAAGMGNPMGISPRDVDAQTTYRFGNY